MYEPHNHTPRVLLLGAGGQLGRRLAVRLPAVGWLTALTRAELDITDSQAVQNVISNLRPHFVINAAAYTDVDRAETEFERARAVNAVAPLQAALMCKRIGAIFVHLSTGYVFSGREAPRPYRPEDVPGPRNAYGHSKLLGETWIERSGCEYLILRSGWVYSSDVSSFPARMLALAGTRPALEVVQDQVGNPTHAADLADGISTWLSTYVLRSPAERAGLLGRHHLASPDYVSRYEFVKTLVDYARQAGLPIATEDIRPISTRAFEEKYNSTGTAARPAWSVLDSSALELAGGPRLPDWRAGLRRFVREAAEAGLPGAPVRMSA